MFYGVLGTFNGFLAMAMGHYLYGHLWHFMNSSISEKLIQVLFIGLAGALILCVVALCPLSILGCMLSVHTLHGV